VVTDERVNEIERWFVRRGVPHLVEDDIAAEIRQILAVRTAYHVAQGTFAALDLGVGSGTGMGTS